MHTHPHLSKRLTSATLALLVPLLLLGTSPAANAVTTQSASSSSTSRLCAAAQRRKLSRLQRTATKATLVSYSQSNTSSALSYLRELMQQAQLKMPAMPAFSFPTFPRSSSSSSHSSVSSVSSSSSSVSSPSSSSSRSSSSLSSTSSASSASSTTSSSSTSSVASSAWKQRIIDLVNVERQKVALPPITWNAKLETAAQGHADDMRVRNYFDHNTPEGLTPVNRMKAAGYVVTCTQCSWSVAYGENIARGQTTPEQVMNDWMNSEHHRENILSSNFREIGIGISGTYWVQDFGSIVTNP